MAKKIGVLGSGDVAKTLAAGFLQKGHEVMIGSRSPEKLADWAAGQAGMKTGTFAETAAFGEVVVLCVLGRAAEEALTLAGAANLAGKPVIDTTNPIADAPPRDGVLSYFTPANSSLMEQLQAKFPQAHLVKAFNSVGAGLMVDPQLPAGRPTMFYCGNDEDAKATVAAIILHFGWKPYDCGKAAAAGPIEALCQLWCLPGFLRNDWAHAFAMLEPQP